MREFMKMEEEERAHLLDAMRDALQPRLLRRTNATVQHCLPDKVCAAKKEERGLLKNIIVEMK